MRPSPSNCAGKEQASMCCVFPTDPVTIPHHQTTLRYPQYICSSLDLPQRPIASVSRVEALSVHNRSVDARMITLFVIRQLICFIGSSKSALRSSCYLIPSSLPGYPWLWPFPYTDNALALWSLVGSEASQVIEDTAGKLEWQTKGASARATGCVHRRR